MSVAVKPVKAWPPKLRLVAAAWLDMIDRGTVMPIGPVAVALRVSYGTAERAFERLREEGVIAQSGDESGWRILDRTRAAALRREAGL